MSSDFAGALRRLMQAAPTERRQSPRGFVDADSVAKHVGTGFKVPLACAELYREWIRYPNGPNERGRRGALSHLSLETVARLAVDIYLDEFHAWVNRVGAHAESRTPHP